MEESAPSSAYEEWLARREAHIRLCAAGGEDRLSALPDDVLRIILRRLDTRSALATAALSKHWARFRRDLPVLQFRVSDILPECYYRYLGRRQDTTDTRKRKRLDVLISRYERRSMRSMAISVKSFLDAEDEVDDDYVRQQGQSDGARRRRRAHALTLELFPNHNTGPFNRLVAKAVGDWGVQDLEIVARVPTPPCHDGQGQDDVMSYNFPHHCFDDDGLKSPTNGLKKLKLSNCTPLPAPAHNNAAAGSQWRAFSSLTMLVLQDMPKWTRSHVYQRIVRACPTLEVLHLKSCVLYDLATISIDAPDSQITELVVDGCTFVGIALRSLPRLERLALVGPPVLLGFGSLPRLSRLNVSIYQDPNNHRHPLYPDMQSDRSVLSVIDPLAENFRDLESLVVRFTGPENWVVPIEGLRLGNVLKRLLLADMQQSWDISWTCLLLQAAPYLETLHVHVADHDGRHVGMAVHPAIPEPPSGFKNRALREVVIIGFKGTEKHVGFVRFLVRNGWNTLENVTLLKHGRVREMGLWDWEVMMDTPEEEQCHWSDEDRDAMLREIKHGGNASSTTRIVFG